MKAAGRTGIVMLGGIAALAIWQLPALADTAPVVPGPMVLPWGGQPAVQPAPVPATPADILPSAETIGGVAVTKAQGMLGVPYSWGGGTVGGSSLGSGRGATTDGFDCSGLVTWAYAQAGLDWSKLDPVHIKAWGRLNAQMIYALSQPLGTDPAQIKPGDPLFFGTPNNVHHIGLYLGRQNGAYLMVDAPHTGATVRVEAFLSWPDFLGAGRLPGATDPAGNVISDSGSLVLPWGGGVPTKTPKPSRDLPDVAPPPIKQEEKPRPPAKPVVPTGPPNPAGPAAQTAVSHATVNIPAAASSGTTAPALPAGPTAESATPANQAVNGPTAGTVTQAVPENPTTAIPVVVTPWGSASWGTMPWRTNAAPGSQPVTAVPVSPADILPAVPADPSSVSAGQTGGLSPDCQAILPIINAQAQTHNLEPALLMAVAQRETNCQNELGQDGGGVGPLQVDRRYHPSYPGMTLTDNIAMGAQILADDIGAFGGDVRDGVAAYNAGVGGVQRGLADSGDPDQYTTHGDYSADVMRRAEMLRSQGLN